MSSPVRPSLFAGDVRGLIEGSVRRRVTVVMVTVAVLAFGVVGYQRLPLELFPDITYPSLTVQTEFPDTAPQEVENLVTRLHEKQVTARGNARHDELFPCA